MEIGSRIVTKTKRSTHTSPTRQRRTSKQASSTSLRPQSAKLNAKFLDLTLRPEKKKRGRPTTAKPRDVKFTPEYPQRGCPQPDRSNDAREPATAATALWSDDDDDDGGIVGDDVPVRDSNVAAPSCSKLKMIVVQSILQREECLATIVEGCQEGGWGPGNEGIARILPLLMPLRLHSLAVVESILRWKAAANNRSFMWDGTSYFHKMATDTDALDPYLSLELGFPVLRNPFLSSMALDTPQLTLLVCCPHKQQRTDDVVQCIARRLHFGALEPGDMALNTRVIAAMVAIVKEEMERQLVQETTMVPAQPLASYRLDMSTVAFEPEPEAPAFAAPHKQVQRQQANRSTRKTAAAERAGHSSKQRPAPNEWRSSHPHVRDKSPSLPTATHDSGWKDDPTQEDVYANADLRRIFALCNDVSTAASHLQRQLHVLDTATMDATASNETMTPLRSPARSHSTSTTLITPLWQADATPALPSQPSPEVSPPTTSTVIATQDKLTSYIDTLSARIARLRAFDAEAATDADYASLALPEPSRALTGDADDRDDDQPLSSKSLSPIAPRAKYRTAPSPDKAAAKPKMKLLKHDKRSAYSPVPSSRRSPHASKQAATASERSDKDSTTKVSKLNRGTGTSRLPARTGPFDKLDQKELEDDEMPAKVAYTQPATTKPPAAQILRDGQQMPSDSRGSQRAMTHHGHPPKTAPRDTDYLRRKKSGDHRMHCVAEHRAALRLQGWWRHAMGRRVRYQRRRLQEFAVQTIEWAYMRHRRRRRRTHGGPADDETSVVTVVQQWARRRLGVRREWRTRCHEKRRVVAVRSIQRSWRAHQSRRTAAVVNGIQQLVESIVDHVSTSARARSAAASSIQSSYWTWRFNQHQVPRQCGTPTPVHASTKPLEAPGPSILPGSSRGYIPPLMTGGHRDVQDQYADEGFESDASGGRNVNVSSTRDESCRATTQATPQATPHDADEDAYPDDTIPDAVDPKGVLMLYFIQWMTNRLRRIQYRELESRAKRERVRLALMTWHGEGRRRVRVRTAFGAWRDQAQLEKNKRVQTRTEFAQSAKAWKQLQRGKQAASTLTQ